MTAEEPSAENLDELSPTLLQKHSSGLPSLLWPKSKATYEEWPYQISPGPAKPESDLTHLRGPDHTDQHWRTPSDNAAPTAGSARQTLVAGKETGSNAKLLIRLCCKWDLFKLFDMLLSCSWASGLISLLIPGLSEPSVVGA